MFFNENGIDLSNWKELLKSGEKASIDTYFARVSSLNLRNSIFIDITANHAVCLLYTSDAADE